MLSTEICNEYRDIFSIDSGDVGKTPLIEIEIDMGDHPTNYPKAATLFL